MKDSPVDDIVTVLRSLSDKVAYLEKENLKREVHIKILIEDVEGICNTINLIIDELNDD